MTNPLYSFSIRLSTGGYWYFRGTLSVSLKTKVAGSSQTTGGHLLDYMCHKPGHYNMKLCIIKTAILWQTKFQMGDMKFSWMWPKTPVIWDVLPCSLVPIYKHFGEISSISIFKVDKSILKAAASGKQLPKYSHVPLDHHLHMPNHQNEDSPWFCIMPSFHHTVYILKTS